MNNMTMSFSCLLGFILSHVFAYYTVLSSVFFRRLLGKRNLSLLKGNLMLSWMQKIFQLESGDCPGQRKTRISQQTWDGFRPRIGSFVSSTPDTTMETGMTVWRLYHLYIYICIYIYIYIYIYHVFADSCLGGCACIAC